MFIRLLLASGIVTAVSQNSAFAAGSLEFISYYKILLSSMGLNDAAIGRWLPTAGAIFTLTVLTIVGLRYRSCVEGAANPEIPDGNFSVKAAVEALMDMISNLASGIIGEDKYSTFMPLLGGLFFFILVSNLSGLIPGLFPATDSLNTNLAMSLLVFLVYNIAGIKEHRGAYVKQFLGPVVFLMPLMLIIEVIGHLARPLSLSLRLYGNIFGDHLVLTVFTGLTYLVFPAALLFFGLMVASLQSFVFTLLTSIYISMAMSHDH